MSGQRPPISGSNEPLIVARRLVPMRGRLAGVRPDVTRWRSRWSSTSFGSRARALFATACTHTHVRKLRADFRGAPLIVYDARYRIALTQLCTNMTSGRC